jgi:hypothetical protein
LSVKTYTRYSSAAVPSSAWLPVHRYAGVSSCAGELGLPFEKTSETVPTSVIGPPVTAGFEDV